MRIVVAIIANARALLRTTRRRIAHEWGAM